jgi:phage-related baseplate assembly protein
MNGDILAERVKLFGFDLADVPDIDFAVKDASIVQADTLANYEKAFREATNTAKRLGRADPIRIFLLNQIYQCVTQRSIVDSTGKQNLIKYSQGDKLDNIGARWGPTRGRRIPAQRALTVLRFILSQTLTIDAIIPYHTLAQTNEGIRFRTRREGRIPRGQLTVDVPAEAEIPGSIANDFQPGDVSELVSWNAPFLVGVTNLVITSGGADRENDAHFRARIWMAPESFSVAGPYGAYEYWTASVNPDIESVEIFGDPRIPGEVWIYFLMVGGRDPTDAEKQQVIDLFHPPTNRDDIRPLTDFVSTPEFDVIPFITNATYYIDIEKAVFATEIRQAAEDAYGEYLQWQQEEINRDIVPNKMTQFLMNAGVKRVEYRWTNPAPPVVELLHTGYTPVPSPGYLGCAVARFDPNSPGLRYGGLEAKVLPAPALPPP